jgi:hypothetical protein
LEESGKFHQKLNLAFTGSASSQVIGGHPESLLQQSNPLHLGFIGAL